MFLRNNNIQQQQQQQQPTTEILLKLASLEATKVCRVECRATSIPKKNSRFKSFYNSFATVAKAYPIVCPASKPSEDKDLCKVEHTIGCYSLWTDASKIPGNWEIQDKRKSKTTLQESWSIFSF